MDEVRQREALFVYESIQLDLNWINPDEDDSNYDDQLKLNNLILLRSKILFISLNFKLCNNIFVISLG